MSDLGLLDPAQLTARLVDASNRELILLKWRLSWLVKARQKQIPPAGLWEIWMITSGRGFGKTLSGAEWLGWEAANDPVGDENNYSFVVAPTYDDVKLTCFEGPTGLLRVIPEELILDYNKGTPELTLDNGGIIRGFTAREPDRLRGPQCRRAWCEEIGSWLYDVDTWDNLIFGLRLGDKPQIAVTSTPKPRPLVNQLYKDKKVHLVRGTTYENRDNLAPVFLERVLKYEGTKLGRQEIHGELIDPEEAGIVKRSQFRLWPHDRPLPEFVYVIMSLDTAFTEKTRDKETGDPDPTACSVWGVFHQTLELESFRGRSKKVPIPGIMLLDAWEDFLGFPDLVARVKEERKARYGAPTKPVIDPLFIGGKRGIETDGRKVDLILIEDKGSGRSLRQALEVDGIQAYPYLPKVDKLARLHETSPIFARGRVWTVESEKKPGSPRAWAEPLISQCCTFRGEGTVARDDLMDTTTQAIIVATHFGLIRAMSDHDIAKDEQEKFERSVKGIPEDDGYIEQAMKRAMSLSNNPYAS